MESWPQLEPQTSMIRYDPRGGGSAATHMRLHLPLPQSAEIGLALNSHPMLESMDFWRNSGHQLHGCFLLSLAIGALRAKTSKPQEVSVQPRHPTIPNIPGSTGLV